MAERAVDRSPPLNRLNLIAVYDRILNGISELAFDQLWNTEWTRESKLKYLRLKMASIVHEAGSQHIFAHLYSSSGIWTQYAVKGSERSGCWPSISVLLQCGEKLHKSKTTCVSFIKTSTSVVSLLGIDSNGLCLRLQQFECLQLRRARNEANIAALLHQPTDPPVVVEFLCSNEKTDCGNSHFSNYKDNKHN